MRLWGGAFAFRGDVVVRSRAAAAYGDHRASRIPVLAASEYELHTSIWSVSVLAFADVKDMSNAVEGVS